MKNLITQIYLFVIILLSTLIQNTYAQTWIPQTTNEGNPITAIQAIDENVVWAAGWEGSVLRTIDGGENWVAGTVSGTDGFDFISIAAIDANTAYFSGAAFNGTDTRIYKTIDGGSSWELQYQNTTPDAYINSIAFWDESNGIAVSDAVDSSFVILTTSDGGANWVQVPSTNNIFAPLPGEWAGYGYPGGTCLAVEGSSNVWFGTAYGPTSGQLVRIFKSTDTGQSWSVAETPYPMNFEPRGIATMVFKDSLTGFAGGNGALMKTTDGGQNWTLDTTFLYPDNLSSIEIVPGTNGQIIMTASEAGTAYSNDGGTSWMNMSNDEFFNLSFVNDSTGWAAAGWEQGVGGLISKFDGKLITSIDNLSAHNDGLFSISYPNPFRSKTTIKFYLSDRQQVKLQIFNSDGKLIKTLLDELKPSGNHQVVFDGKKLPSGIYHYRLHAGNNVDFKKLILIK